MENMYIAVDIGATSGRVLLEQSDGSLNEIHRFPNIIKEKYWDLDGLFEEVLTGIKKCKPTKEHKVSLSIDTWGCDYVLLDHNGNSIGPSQSYRTPETGEAIGIINDIISEKALFERTGTQFQPFNTVYQLVRDNQIGRLNNASSLLFIPDYFNYKLTGKKYNELTVSSTSQLLNLESQKWDNDFLEKIGIPTTLLSEIIFPGNVIGSLTPEMKEIIGFDIDVIACASHDTASAFKGSNTTNELILSSGTWSLLGVHLKKPNYSQIARDQNFTNELAYDGSVRFLKNIMGLWVVNELKNEIYPNISFEELIQKVTLNGANKFIFDINDESLLSPISMKEAILRLSNESLSGHRYSNEKLFYSVFNSLAHSYKETIDHIQTITNTKFSTLTIVGGGVNNSLINDLIEHITDVKVLMGPTEATGIGNILAQKQCRGEI